MKSILLLTALMMGQFAYATPPEESLGEVSYAISDDTDHFPSENKSPMTGHRAEVRTEADSSSSAVGDVSEIKQGSSHSRLSADRVGDAQPHLNGQH